jgi:hypothetical protein
MVTDVKDIGSIPLTREERFAEGEQNDPVDRSE